MIGATFGIVAENEDTDEKCDKCGSGECSVRLVFYGDKNGVQPPHVFLALGGMDHNSVGESTLPFNVGMEVYRGFSFVVHSPVEPTAICPPNTTTPMGQSQTQTNGVHPLPVATHTTATTGTSGGDRL